MADTEQGGAPSASAGGAPAPDLRALCAAALPALDATRKVFEAAQYAMASEVQPADRKPVFSEPGLDTDWDEDTDAQVIHGIGWSLSWGCKLSIARDHDTGEHYVCVNTSGEDQRRGIVSRSTTREQIASFGQQLLNVFGEPDQRDAEIERLRDQLGEVCTALHNQLSDYDECGVFTRDHALYLVRQLGGRVRLRDMTIKAMQEMTRPSSLPDQRGIEIEQLRKRLAYDLGLPSDEVVNVPLVELLQRLKTMHMTALDEARSRNGDMRTEVEELETQRDEHVRAIREVMADCNDYAARLRDTDAAYAKVTAERDRLRQELDLVGERHAAGLVTLRTDFTAAVNGLLPKLAEPNRQGCPCKSQCDYLDGEGRCSDSCDCAAGRRWVAGDPEPEIGVTVRRGSAWYVRRQNGWHDPHECPADCGKQSGTWAWLTGLGGELVEVVTTDG